MLRSFALSRFGRLLTASATQADEYFQPTPNPAMNDLPLIASPEIEKVRPFFL
jgi:hypothetical protein